jgi:hypothetical protein
MPFIAQRWAPLALGTLALGFGLALGVLSAHSCGSRAAPLLPPASSSVTIVSPTPNVLARVRDLARLETAQFHMERVIDLTDKQSKLFGLIQTEDAILLVAVANIGAGVDLQKLEADDVVIDIEHKRAAITLPAPEILHSALDGERTYVHARRTGALAERKENLETRARQEAERALLEAAREAGILARAGENARRNVEALVRSLGYEHVEVQVREGS